MILICSAYFLSVPRYLNALLHNFFLHPFFQVLSFFFFHFLFDVFSCTKSHNARSFEGRLETLWLRNLLEYNFSLPGTGTEQVLEQMKNHLQSLTMNMRCISSGPVFKPSSMLIIASPVPSSTFFSPWPRWNVAIDSVRWQFFLLVTYIKERYISMTCSRRTVVERSLHLNFYGALGRCLRPKYPPDLNFSSIDGQRVMYPFTRQEKAITHQTYLWSSFELQYFFWDRLQILFVYLHHESACRLRWWVFAPIWYCSRGYRDDWLVQGTHIS